MSHYERLLIRFLYLCIAASSGYGQDKMKKHSKNWGGSRPGAGRKTRLSEEMIRVSRSYTERLGEDANDPDFYIYQLFAAGTDGMMPASEVKRLGKTEAGKLVASQRGWHAAKPE